MTAPTVADLLGDLLAPVRTVAPILAKAANPANRKDSCGSAADSTRCESLRNLANPLPALMADRLDSQTFAGVRRLPEGPQSEQRRGVSQDSQDSQGCPEAIDRAHRIRRRGFTEPDAVALAERLHLRDVQGDRRRMCVECVHLQARPWRCRNHKAADVPHELAGELTTILQDCPGFNTAR